MIANQITRVHASISFGVGVGRVIMDLVQIHVLEV